MSSQTNSDDTEWIWKRANGIGGSTNRIHTDPDCPFLNQARKIHRYPRSSYPDADECDYCSGERDPSEFDNSDWSHYNALVEASKDGGMS